MLLVNALTQPYLDLVHDARLYSLQVLDRVEPGLYSNDLYLRYGSQDSFSIFSKIIAPFVTAIGIRPAFFLFYLLSNAFLFYAAQRFVFSIVKIKIVAFVSLLFFATTLVPFGGLSIFHVNESFLTPRIAAFGMTLIGLERLLKERYVSSLAVILVSMVVHPVISFCGFLVWSYFVLTRFLSTRQFVAVVISATVVVLAVLGYYPLGSQLFGEMDPAWKKPVHAANYYAIPTQWKLMDWFRIVVAFLIVLTSRQILATTKPLRRLMDGILVVGVLAVVGGLVAPFLPYALIFQGQPYRALWLLQFVQVPFIFSLVRFGMLKRREYRMHAGCLLGLFIVSTMTSLHIISLLSLAIILRVRQSQTKASSSDSNWSLLWVSAFLFTCIFPLLIPLIACWKDFCQKATPLSIICIIPFIIGPAFTMLVSGKLLLGLFHRFGRARFQVMTLLGFLAFQSFCAIIVHVPLWGGTFASSKKDMDMLEAFVNERFDNPNELPTVYWSQSRLDSVWVNLKAKSYFACQQVAGNMFNRGTAIEGQRRADLVRNFELTAFRENCSSAQAWIVRSMEDIFGETASEPTIDDLNRLCDEDVDFVICFHPIDNLYSATVGPYFVYDCSVLREKLNTQVVGKTNQEQLTDEFHEIN